MHDYTDVDAFPDIVQLIDDSDAPNATNLNTSPEGLLNRTRYLWKRTIGRLYWAQPFTLDGPWTVPPNVTTVTAYLIGGGGGGGAGNAYAGTLSGHTHASGSGGGGAMPTSALVTVTPGDILGVTIGLGGPGGASAGANGADGTDSFFFHSDLTTPYAVGFGAGGGFGDTLVGPFTDRNHLSRSGQPRRASGDSWGGSANVFDFSTFFVQNGPQAGGFGGSKRGFAGGGSSAASGGSVSATAADSSGFFGGACGGSGGAGPILGATGGAGGTGGTSNAGGVGGNGGVGGVGTVYGAGGGGGGAAGNGSGGSGTPGNGGAGGKGLVILVWSTNVVDP